MKSKLEKLITEIRNSPGLFPEADTLLGMAIEAQRTGKLPDLSPLKDRPKTSPPSAPAA